jgi:hypothetical protein
MRPMDPDLGSKLEALLQALEASRNGAARARGVE